MECIWGYGRRRKIDRNNNGIIDYFGVYFQLEYAVDNLSVFVQGSGSSKGFQREEFYLYKTGDPLQYSEKVNIAGGTIKVVQTLI